MGRRGSRSIERVDIVAVLEHYGAEYIPVSNRWRAMRCPFHDDRSASASVNTDLGKFHCFAGCEISGDGLDIIAWREGVNDFPSTVEIAERILGESVGNLLRKSKGRTRRNSLSEVSGDIRGQRSLVSARPRRQPIAGT